MATDPDKIFEQWARRTIPIWGPFYAMYYIIRYLFREMFWKD